jgi:hypothetical protein
VGFGSVQAAGYCRRLGEVTRHPSPMKGDRRLGVGVGGPLVVRVNDATNNQSRSDVSCSSWSDSGTAVLYALSRVFGCVEVVQPHALSKLRSYGS